MLQIHIIIVLNWLDFKLLYQWILAYKAKVLPARVIAGITMSYLVLLGPSILSTMLCIALFYLIFCNS